MTHLTLVTAAPPEQVTYDELRDAVAAWADVCASLAETILRNLDSGTRSPDLLAGVIEQLREDQALLAALQCVLDHETA
jgi:hypothetical protein